MDKMIYYITTLRNITSRILDTVEEIRLGARYYVQVRT